MNTIKPVVYYGDKKIKLGEEADGKKFGYSDIDRDKLSAFSLEKDGEEIIRLHLDEDKRLIWRERNYIVAGSKAKTIHLLGWQKTIKGENVQSIAYVFDDGKVELAGRFREGHPVFNSIELLDEEKDN